MLSTLKAKLFAKVKALICKIVGHKAPAPRRWDEVPSRTYTCARCGEPDQKLY